MTINVSWTALKAFAAARGVPIQYVVANNMYYIAVTDGPMELQCQIPMDGSDTSDQSDFETNCMPSANQPLLPLLTSVTTALEKTNKVLKLACGSGTVNSSGQAVISIKVPGTFGSGAGRYVLGGYGISADYNINDNVTLRIEDTDRNVAMLVARAANPAATSPVPDSVIQGMGVIPGIGQAFPAYPVMQTYTDDEMAAANQGWYFWPLSTGSGAAGEVEINPIGGYGFIPAGLYVIVTYQRPSGITTGQLNINFDWGQIVP